MMKYLWSDQIEILSSLTVNSNPSDSSSSCLTSPQNNARRKTQCETLLPEKQPRLRPLFLYLALSSSPPAFAHSGWWWQTDPHLHPLHVLTLDTPRGTLLKRPWRKQFNTDLLSETHNWNQCTLLPHPLGECRRDKPNMSNCQFNLFMLICTCLMWLGFRIWIPYSAILVWHFPISNIILSFSLALSILSCYPLFSQDVRKGKLQ